MIRTAIISVTASFVLFGAWVINLVSYHSAPDLNPLTPISAPVEFSHNLSSKLFGDALVAGGGMNFLTNAIIWNISNSEQILSLKLTPHSGRDPFHSVRVP